MNGSFVGSEDGFFIPPGREVIINSGDSNVLAGANSTLVDKVNTHLIYEGGLSVKIENTYDNLIENSGNNFMTLLGSSFSFGGYALPSGQFALQGMQVWKETRPIEFSIETKLLAKDSPRKQVWNPAWYLASITTPSTTNSNGTTTKWNLIPPGPNIATILGQINPDWAKQGSAGGLTYNGAKGEFSVDIGGYISFQNVVVTSITPTFSESLIEEDGELYPLSCDLSIDFRTILVATESELQKFMR